ncbi:MAG TPA: metal ABC transporter substrate-binding protein [Acidobacteriota bacterium]
MRTSIESRAQLRAPTRRGHGAAALLALATLAVGTAADAGTASQRHLDAAATASDAGAGSRRQPDEAVASGASSGAQRQLRVVASLTPYRSIAEEILGDNGTVESIATPRQDAHFVQAKPSYSIMLSRADLLLATGLDLEMWMPAVIDKSRNPRIREGEPGYVSVATGVPMLEVPADTSRAGGDIHVFGNPHVHTDPLRAVIVANNIKIGLQNVDGDNAAYYEERFRAFKSKIHERLFGAELIGLVGGDKLADLAMRKQLRAFLQETQIGGAPLLDRQGGWLAEAECLRGRRIVAYHLNWVYLMDRFDIEVAAYVERRPGIPPSASHVATLIELIRRESIPVLWVANYFDEQTPRLIAERTGATFLYVPLYTDPGSPDLDEYTELIDTWIETMKGAVPGC